MRFAAAFDATGVGLVAAIGAVGDLRAVRRTPGPRGQVEEIAPALKSVVDESGVDWRDLDRIGVVVGPGSFVGVRVGVAAARGLGVALGARVDGVDGFLLAAETARRSGVRSAAAAVVFGNGGRLVWRRYVIEPDAVRTHASDGAFSTGDRAALEAEGCDRLIGPGVEPDWRGADAAALVELAFDEARSVPARPFYVRAPEAAPPSRRPAPRL